MTLPGTVRKRWRRADVVELVLSFGAFALAVHAFARFGAQIETRPGVVLRDPVLALLAPRDLTWVIFIVIYACVGCTVLLLWRDPPAFALAFRAYALMVVFRIIAMSVTPLDAPLGAIPLRDPFIDQLWNGRTLTRDLFFSGHTASLCIVVLATPVRYVAARRWFAAGACVVGACVLWQRVHYTVDVLAAPVFSYAAWRLAITASGRAASLREATVATPASVGAVVRRLRRDPHVDRKAS